VIGLPVPPREYFFIEEQTPDGATAVLFLFDRYGDLLPGKAFITKEAEVKWEAFARRIIRSTGAHTSGSR
jgi:hypothetical protein